MCSQKTAFLRHPCTLTSLRLTINSRVPMRSALPFTVSLCLRTWQSSPAPGLHVEFDWWQLTYLASPPQNPVGLDHAINNRFGVLI